MADTEPPAKKKCLGADCENDAGSLQCPTCLKLGIKDSFFCSQDCFKKNWVCPSLLVAQLSIAGWRREFPSTPRRLSTI